MPKNCTTSAGIWKAGAFCCLKGIKFPYTQKIYGMRIFALMKKAQKKKLSDMDKLTQGYEKFMKGKELNENGRELFSKAIEKATKIKQRGSK